MEKGRTSSGLEIIQSCLSCPLQEERLFCRLGPQALAELNAMRQTRVWPKGAVLFLQGQAAHGLFILCSGRAKLVAAGSRGRSLIVRVANPGEVLGLSAVMSNTGYDLSAEALELAQTSFLPREEFLRFLQTHAEVSVRVAQHLSMELHEAYQRLTRTTPALSARARLAGVLLDWARQDAQPPQEPMRFQLSLTHEEIGELVGSSRETVTRLLNDFRRKGLIQIEGTFVRILDRRKLEAFLG